MEEQVSWKGHTFTLLVFTGIVVLCSIFFILGMLVGRVQAQKIASNATPAPAAKADVKPEPTEQKPDLTFYDALKNQEQTHEPAALRAEPAKPERPPPPAPPPVVTSRPDNSLNYQIGAVRKSADAEKLLNDVKKKGFRAFILAPAADDLNPFFRVQVGPFSDEIAAQDAKVRLEGAGYQPILKK
jgi:cell division septation protein DedD